MYRHHEHNPQFQPRVSYVLDSFSQLGTYAVVQFLFDEGTEVPIVMPPHGNAKNQVNPYHYTQKSTIDKLMQIAGKPKMVVASVHDEAGGSLHAKNASELPRD